MWGEKLLPGMHIRARFSCSSRSYQPIQPAYQVSLITSSFLTISCAKDTVKQALLAAPELSHSPLCLRSISR